MKPFITFDIETGPLADVPEPVFKPKANLKNLELIAKDLADKREAWLESATLDSTRSRVLAVGWFNAASCSLCLNHGGDEQELLGGFWQEWRESHGEFEFVGWNCFGFDLPFLVQRSRVRGVEVPWGMRRERRWDPSFKDAMLEWLCGVRLVGRTSEDAHPKASLNVVASVMGCGEPAVTGSGAMFHKLYADTATREMALEKLRHDLRRTACVWGKLAPAEAHQPDEDDLVYDNL